MPFYPGPGLGGHCIPIDPFYLAWKANKSDRNTRFIELAGEINTAMPQQVVARVEQALAAQKKKINGSRVLVLGIAYKADVDDDRESPSYRLMDLLKAHGAGVAYYDPHIPVIRRRATRALGGNEIRRVESKKHFGLRRGADRDGARRVNFQELADSAQLIVDTRNAMAGIKTADGKV